MGLKRVPTGIFGMLCAGLIWLQCANPVDEDPLKWNQKIDFPVTNEVFTVGEQLDGFFDMKDMDILRVEQTYSSDPTRLYEDTTLGDTVAFSVLRDDLNEFEMLQDTTGDELYHDVLGAIPITAAPSFSHTLTKPAGAGPFDLTFPVTMNDIYYIRFYDTTTNNLDISFTNQSDDPIEDLVFGIDGLGTENIGTIAAGETETATFSVSRGTLSHTTNITLQGTASSADAQDIQIGFCLNGLYADSLSVNDHLVSFSKQYSNRYELVDTLKVDYIDIDYGFFYYSLNNYTGIPLQVSGNHLHLWSNGNMEDSISTLEELSEVSDSSEYAGILNPGSGNIISPRTEHQFNQKNISNCRLFTQWNADEKMTYTTVIYTIETTPPTGDTLSLSARDSLTFAIHTNAFTFDELVGTVMEPYIGDGDTQKVAVELPLGEEAADSLRGRLILQNVESDLHITANMSEGAYIDTMTISFLAFPSDSAEIVESITSTFLEVENGKPYIRSLNLTDVVNCFPDTISIVSRVRIPAGTKVKIVNDLRPGDADFGNYMGRMVVSTNATYRINADLDWEIRQDIGNLDLGSSTFPVIGPLQYIRKMARRRLLFNMDITNSSNVNMNLYALIAPQHLIDSLDSLTDSQVASIIHQEGKAEELGYVNFLGTRGLHFPERNPDTTVSRTVELNDEQLGIILDSDSCSWRWQMTMLEQDRDALSDTDFIRIHSWLRVQGEGNSDSLLIW
ncbi:MAG: hypothetical protein ACLFSB_01960 [Chitinispirillaceae bacterium]